METVLEGLFGGGCAAWHSMGCRWAVEAGWTLLGCGWECLYTSAAAAADALLLHRLPVQRAEGRTLQSRSPQP